ncbi:TetR/AcrR family transcriptional regulator [Bacillus massiliigorillae]|uniref:TetR/AcrR family transcriptional regulator n=1 Tax=Bacillus massiliigorillae TaxID=1243664 RepID=UPI0003A7CE00|nr:TetR/AcrR family transcriptional regulator [Bacillus massiliigorillae]
MNGISTRELSKQRKKETILTKAEELFLKKGIDNTKMNDIAEEAGIGVATLFRYFPKKEKIILTIATAKIQIMLEAFRIIEEKPISCIDKITFVLDFFIEQMKENNASLPKLLDHFINYTAIAGDSLEDMEMYISAREEIFTVFARMVEEGKTDGTIRGDIKTSQILPTMIGNFAVFALKLSLKGTANLIKPDLAAEVQLKIMKEIFLDYLKS